MVVNIRVTAAALQQAAAEPRVIELGLFMIGFKITGFDETCVAHSIYHLITLCEIHERAIQIFNRLVTLNFLIALNFQIFNCKFTVDQHL